MSGESRLLFPVPASSVLRTDDLPIREARAVHGNGMGAIEQVALSGCTH
jgi:hypothetical protein